VPLDEKDPEALGERQRFARRSVLVAAKLMVDGRTLDVDILDISEGGAKITAPEPVEVGTAVDLLVEEVGRYPSQVAWRNGHNHGLEFLASPEAIAAELPQIIEKTDEARERRRHARTTVLWKAEIYGGIRRAPCEVLNVSDSGMRLRVTTEFKPGTEVTVRSIRFGERKARVIWRQNDRLGIEFLGAEAEA
jgi:hypothetical protein